MDKAYVTFVEIYYCRNCRSDVEAINEIDQSFYLTFGRRIYPTYRIKPPRKVCARCGYPYIYSKGYGYRFICPSCKEVIYLKEKPEKLKCKGCGKEFIIEKEVSACFIATAVFENQDVYEVFVLRNLRDNFLIKTKSGRYMVELYYKFSPEIAVILKKNKFLKIFVRGILKILIMTFCKLTFFKNRCAFERNVEDVL